MVTLKPGDRRRIVAEMLILKKYNNFRDCAYACQKYADDNNIDVTFNKLAIQHYVSCVTNLSTNRLKILSRLLGVTDYAKLDEVFTFPNDRGQGYKIIGDNGTEIVDMDLRNVLD